MIEVPYWMVLILVSVPYACVLATYLTAVKVVRASETLATRALASDKTWHPAKEVGSLPESIDVAQMSEAEAFQRQQAEYDEMERIITGGPE